jgi:hypothetical protein
MTMLGAIFPRTVGGVLIGLALVQVALALGGRGGQGGGEGADTSWDGLGRRLALVAVMLAWAILFPHRSASSSPASSPPSPCSSWPSTSAPSSAVRGSCAIAIVVAMVGIFYWLMVRVLYIPMPRGWLI